MNKFIKNLSMMFLFVNALLWGVVSIGWLGVHFVWWEYPHLDWSLVLFIGRIIVAFGLFISVWFAVEEAN